MKQSWLTTSSYSQKKQKQKQSPIKPHQIQQIPDYQIEKMVDFASAYFFTKMEMRGHNVLSYYSFEDERMREMFEYERGKEEEMWREGRKGNKNEEMSEQESDLGIFRRSEKEMDEKLEKERSEDPDISILNSKVIDEFDLDSSNNSKLSNKPSSNSNSSKKLPQNTKTKPIKQNRSSSQSQSDILPQSQQLQKTKLAINFNFDLNELNQTENHPQQNPSAFKKQKPRDDVALVSEKKKKQQVVEVSEKSSSQSEKSSEKSMSSFHANESYRSSEDGQSQKEEEVREVKGNIKDSGFKKNKSKEKINLSGNKTTLSKEIKSSKKQPYSTEKEDQKINNSTTGKKLPSIPDEKNNTKSKTSNNKQAQIEANQLKFNVKGLNSAKKQPPSTNPSHQQKPLPSSNPYAKKLQLQQSLSNSNSSSSHQSLQSSKCFDEIDLDQLPDFNDSDLFPSRKFSKLHPIQQQQQNLSTLKTNLNPKHPQTLHLHKEISNLSCISKTKSNLKDMKIVLELQRIQLSINHLQDTFDNLMNYELAFPKEEIKFKVIDVKKTKPRLQLGSVVDLDEGVSDNRRQIF